MTKVIEQYCTQNPCYKENRPLDKVQKLIVHSPAVIKASGYSSDVIITGDQWYTRWNKASIQKLAHGFIDTDGVHLFLPLNITGWQAGNWTGNCHSVGFELCEYTDLEKARKVYNNAVAYYAELVRKFGLTVADVIGHKEAHDTWYASNHSDPDPYFKTFGKSMKTFREDLTEYMNRQDNDAELTEQVVQEDEEVDYFKGVTIDTSFTDIGGVRYAGKQIAVRIAPSEEAKQREEFSLLGPGNGFKVWVKTMHNWGLISALGDDSMCGWIPLDHVGKNNPNTNK